jgi:hypothetical protein
MRTRATEVVVQRDELENLRRQLSLCSHDLIELIQANEVRSVRGALLPIRNRIGSVEVKILSLIERAKGGDLAGELMASRGARPKD